MTSTAPITSPSVPSGVDQSNQQLNEQMQKQLEDTQMKNIALETMIDVAEEQLKINIRKKSGPKQ